MDPTEALPSSTRGLPSTEFLHMPRPRLTRITESVVEEETTGAVIIGDVQKIPRTTGYFEIISVAFNLLSSWLTVASTLILGLSHGGSAAVICGLFVILIMYGAVALSLAEMAARYTTAGGQYHWTALLAPESMKRGLYRTLAHFPVVPGMQCDNFGLQSLGFERGALDPQRRM
ncbi:MAG: hypothetical protein Q9178_005969 [Gyalolechia marmorata]